MTIKPAPVRRSLVVKAGPERAFSVFTEGFGRWWPASHTISAGFKTAVIEPRVGGRWFQVGEDGTEADWGHVIAWEPPSRLVLAWQIGAEYRFDPNLVTEVEVRFSPEGDGATRVDFEHRHLERLGERAAALREQFESPNGWGFLLDLFAKAAEARPTDRFAQRRSS
jgi:uncharacterized protein YndB with AHSA1/START domain